MEAPQFNTTANIDYMDDSDSMLVRGIWSEEEHERFLEAMKMYPLGPWRTIADHVRTRSIKQVQTHAQKYQQKVARRQRGLRKQKKRVARPEHRVDQAAAGFIVRKAIERSHEAPGSPTSFEEMLYQATPAAEEHQVQLDAELDTIEPLPFSYCSSSDPFGYATEVHHKDLEDSLILFLASV